MKWDNLKRNILNFIRKKLGKSKPENRKIFVNFSGSEPEVLLDNDFKKKRKDNFIKTSKYTIWNFIPKNLFEQFRRIAYFYFLVNVIVIFAIPDPPSSPYTSIIPLAIVVLVTAVKQAYEDFLRHREDRKINESPTRVLKDGTFKEKKWKNVKVGDILEITAGSMFPCDMLLLNSDADDDVCYITTANLDGETNLKEKSRPKNLVDLDSEQKLSNFKAIILCDHPNTNLYQFKGKLLIEKNEFPITNENILLRGSCLKISPKIYGCAIYTGFDTKVMLNSKLKSNKLSCIEKKLNAFILVFLAILAFLTFLCYGLSFIYQDFYQIHWYLKGTEPMYFNENRNLYNFIFLIYFMNLLNYIVPLSLYVTVEMQRFFGSKFIEWDLKLYDEETDKPAKANTSDLNEDLGQIEYLFSDKTGTLTKNEMVFKQFSINDEVFEEKFGKLYQINKKNNEDIKDQKFFRFFELMSLCHTVQIDLNDKTKYQASSPDEMCFIDFLHNLGIIFAGDKKEKSDSVNKSRTINFLSKKHIYEIKQIFEFDSTRKRMSIIVKSDQTEKYLLYCKGADSAVLSKCNVGDIKTCEAHVKDFGSKGWRTLALAYKELSQQEYEECEQKIFEAYNDIENRNEKIALVYDEIESNLILVGATAIEDKLQEDVADTLKSLRESGIKIWVLTGDKIETAVNISTSCQHFPQSAEKIFLTSVSEIEELKKHINLFLQKIENSQIKNFALVVDGQTLGFIFHNELEESFAKLCSGCDAVLGCRLSPAQKAQIVKLIKKSKTKPITAAIGDGANDVSMIQEAHIGFGLFGKEGNNAAKSSDFCFAKFKFLKRILLFHGYLYYTRSAVLVQYFFYKNVAFVICQVYFAIWNAFSGTTLYNSIILTFYNITLTGAPILFFGVFEQTESEKNITRNPTIYKTIKKNKSLSAFEFFKWNLLGLWHSLVAYFFSFLFIQDDISYHSDGKMSGMMQFGALIIILIDLIVHAKLITEWHFITWFTLFGYVLSILGFVMTCLVPNSFIMPSILTLITDEQNFFWIFYDLFSCGSIWFLMILIVVTAIIPDIIIKIVENLRVSVFLYMEKEGKSAKRKSKNSKSRVGEANYLKSNNAFESGQEDSKNKDSKFIEKKPSIENKPLIENKPSIENQTQHDAKDEKEKYYKTVLTQIDGDVLFNTLV